MTNFAEQEEKSVSVYLPGTESWYYLRNGVTYAGGRSHKMEVFEDGIPTFQKAGTIIPRKDRFRRSSTQMVNDPYTLVNPYIMNLFIHLCIKGLLVK